MTITPPKPDDLAIAFAAALLSTGKYETPGGAITAAWAAVPEFYLARELYVAQIAPMFFETKPTEEFVAKEINWPEVEAKARDAGFSVAIGDSNIAIGTTRGGR